MRVAGNISRNHGIGVDSGLDLEAEAIETTGTVFAVAGAPLRLVVTITASFYWRFRMTEREAQTALL